MRLQTIELNAFERHSWLCDSGEVLIGEEAYNAIHAAFPGAMRAEYLLKGISLPVTAYRLVDA